MALNAIESIVLWGVPIITILITLGYFFYWGKEAEEVRQDPVEEESKTPGGRS